MKCSRTCVDYWQPEVEGPGLCSGVFGVELGGMGPMGGGGGLGGTKVLQVTVQVKRQNIICCLKKGTRGTYCTEGGPARLEQGGLWSVGGRLTRRKKGNASQGTSRAEPGTLVSSLPHLLFTTETAPEKGPEVLSGWFSLNEGSFYSWCLRLGVYPICCLRFKSPSWYDIKTPCNSLLFFPNITITLLPLQPRVQGGCLP